MSYSLTSPVHPWKYFSHTKLRILARLLPRPNTSELRSESSSARSASKLETVDSTAARPQERPRIATARLVGGVYANSESRWAGVSLYPFAPDGQHLRLRRIVTGVRVGRENA